MTGFPTDALIHVGDFGVDFQHTVRDQAGAIVDISSGGGAWVTSIRFTKPDGSSLDRTSTLFTDGTDGVHRWKSTSGFFDQAGTWRREGNAVAPSSAGEWTADRVTFEVAARLAAP